MKIRNIIFFYPSRITGGAEYIFIRYSSFLAKHTPQYNVMYVDYPDGFARRQLQNEKVTFYEYKKGERTVIPEDSVVIFQLNRISDFKKDIEYCVSGTALMFWYLHAENLHSQIEVHGIKLLCRTERRIIGKCIDTLIENESINLMGKHDYIDFRRDFFTGVHEVNIIPYILPIDEYPVAQPKTKCNINPIRFCWLGRLDEEKSRNIFTYLNEIEELHKSYPVTVSLIGNGPAQESIMKEAEKYSYHIEFVGEKRGSELDKYIRNNVDVGLASGTSSLEFGFRGVPVVEQWVIPQVFGAGVCKNYIHLFDRYKQDPLNVYCKKNVTENYFIDKIHELISGYSDISNRTIEFSKQYVPSYGGQMLVDSIEKLEKRYGSESIYCIDKMSYLMRRAVARHLFLFKIKGLITFPFLKMTKSKKQDVR